MSTMNFLLSTILPGMYNDADAGTSSFCPSFPAWETVLISSIHSVNLPLAMVNACKDCVKCCNSWSNCCFTAFSCSGFSLVKSTKFRTCSNLKVSKVSVRWQQRRSYSFTYFFERTWLDFYSALSCLGHSKIFI
ncbi:AGK_G0040030.mRNA.1.CDS.1 [Saccharomyces cerevisiae]|uniref:Putative uncharacterized protein YML094C-A n=1 Tax=Saccharomyces cerevisiae (strain ATCC 204508 / S288c) TaxID=559292 RepID=YM094_YEAST|nr:RecName: Full=Putative uncharacterized protein YML094C-A [Saccharomyces cerevisiae S288C]AAT93308.1 YML095C-A [Saccharomyces cerevisiae]EWG83842.1 hypothetical protein R008_M10316 [Saccharomyces cerevisiae R008]EWG89225.1 hypothetical protein P301_M10306 [Saccharomyces cerevisiae P301]EWG94264.1 hypothetical protein R103_M10306 [Saccharomyces cerevisiae R103]CAA86643.1 unnamed protein product [Saccharomyces cerevisiae]